MKKNFAIILIARRVRFVLGYSEFFLHTKFQQQSQQYQVIVWLQYTTTLSTSSRSLTYMFIFCLKLFSDINVLKWIGSKSSARKESKGLTILIMRIL